MKTLAVVIALSLTVPVLAEEPHKINFTSVLTDQDDQAMTECADNPAPKTDAECKVRHPVTLGMVVLRALVMPEQGLAPEESLKRGQLALSVYKAEAAVLTAEDTALIKKQMAKVYSPLITARAIPILDPATAK